MQDIVSRKLFLGFIYMHILYHAKKEAFYGAWMIQELKEHGYTMSAGTLYPILHGLTKQGLLEIESRLEEGKIKKYYSITSLGETTLKEAKQQLHVLLKEIKEDA